jgi:hypothetical protein
MASGGRSEMVAESQSAQKQCKGLSSEQEGL